MCAGLCHFREAILRELRFDAITQRQAFAVTLEQATHSAQERSLEGVLIAAVVAQLEVVNDPSLLCTVDLVVEKIPDGPNHFVAGDSAVGEVRHASSADGRTTFASVIRRKGGSPSKSSNRVGTSGWRRALMCAMRPRYMSTHQRRVTRRVVILLSIVAIDAAGISAIFPVLPGLLRHLTGRADASLRFGAVVASYSLAQLVSAPLLGGLSDRFGRRPVLLVSIAGAAIDYAVIAFTPIAWSLLVGRLIAGATSANAAVAVSYITDVTSGERRTRYIGYVSGAYSAGFIFGPVLGGLLGNISPRVPFLAAAVLCGLNLGLVYFMLPESRNGSRATMIR